MQAMVENRDERAATTGESSDDALDAALEAAVAASTRASSVVARHRRNPEVVPDDEDAVLQPEEPVKHRVEPKLRAKRTSVRRSGPSQSVPAADAHTAVASTAAGPEDVVTESAHAAAIRPAGVANRQAPQPRAVVERSSMVSKLVVGVTLAASIAAFAVVLLTRFDGSNTRQEVCDAAIAEIRGIIAENPDRTGISRDVLDRVLSAQATSHVNCLFNEVVAVEQAELMPWLGLIPPQTSSPATTVVPTAGG